MTADEMRISDWSSDVCSSDLGAAVIARANAFLDEAVPLASGTWADWQGGQLTLADPAQWVGSKPGGLLLRKNGLHIELDRKSVVEGTNVAVRVDLGCRRIIKKQNKNNLNQTTTPKQTQ